MNSHKRKVSFTEEDIKQTKEKDKSTQSAEGLGGFFGADAKAASYWMKRHERWLKKQKLEQENETAIQR